MAVAIQQPDSFRTSIDASDRLNHDPQIQTFSSPSQESGSKPDEEKLLPQNNSQQAPILEKSLFRSLLSFSWLIHVIALGCTGAAVQLTFNNTYWTDEADWDNKFLWSILRGTRIQDILQFAAKLYEIIIVLSLSAMVMHAFRRMLVGDGVAWGLMSGAYQVGSPSYFFSRELWAPFTKPENPRNFFMALGLALLVIYANMIGPFTAIIISPILEWWPVHDPYNGEKLTSYIQASPDWIYPTLLNDSLMVLDTCSEYAQANCPDSGFPEVKDLVEAWAVSNAKPSAQMNHPGVGTSRELVSSLEYSTDDEHLAIATTLHSSVVELAGAFWNYIDSNESTYNVNQSKRPKFIPEQEDIYAPLVQVQCSRYSYNEIRKTGSKPSFHMGRMRNFSSYHTESLEDSYKSRSSWEVPVELWDFERDDVDETSFEWVDVAPLSADGQPSIGAFVTVPMARHKQNVGNKTSPVQDSILIPCMIDARWASSETHYDPTADNLLPNDLADLSTLSPFWEDKKVRNKNLNQPNILMSLSWADFLNNPTGDVVSAIGSTFNGSAMRWLLDSFVWPDDGESWDFSSFKTAKFIPQSTEDKNDVEAARAVATTLSLAIADAISRVALAQDLGLVIHNNNNGTVQWKQLWLQSSNGTSGSIEKDEKELQDAYAMNWRVERKGWGYGFKTPTIIFGVFLLLLHAGLVLVFCAYVLWFRLVSNGWASGAWGGLSELIALAFTSQRPTNPVIRKIADGDDKWNTMTTPVFVRTVDHEGIELLLGDGSRASRLTIGRVYST